MDGNREGNGSYSNRRDGYRWNVSNANRRDGYGWKHTDMC